MKKSKILGLILALAMLCGIFWITAVNVPATLLIDGEPEEVYEDYFGTGLKYTRYPGGLLVIDGNGEIPDYGSYPPWRDGIGWYYTNYGSPFDGNLMIIKTLVIGNGITRIGNNAFAWCDISGDLIIGENVTSIGDYAFGSNNFTGSLIIGKNVKSIGNGAFANNAFTHLEMGTNVTSIGEEAFYGSNFIGDLIIPNSMTSIGDSAFLGCSFTGNLVIPDSVTSIGDYAFEGCSFTGNLVIPGSVTSIGDYAFYHHSGFTGDLVIPDSVTSIGEYAFFPLYGNTVTFTGNLIIGSPTGDTKANNSLMSIGDHAFEECSFTGCLTICNCVKSIGEDAFYNCKGFTGDLIIPNSVTYIGNSAFSGCSGFTGDLVISDSVTEIGKNAFKGCRGFSGRLVIGNKVKSIEYGTFEECGGFTGDLVIPNSVTSIGDYAFAWCGNFTNIKIGNNVKSIGELSMPTLEDYNIKITIPASVTSIGRDAFGYHTAIYFKGNAPSVVPADDFYASFARGLGDTILYFIEGKSGWTTPTWNGYKTALYVPENVTSVSLDKSAVNLREGKTAQLTATVLPLKATCKDVTWLSSDESVATVNSFGLITAISEGTAIITVKTDDGGHTATCIVTVKYVAPGSIECGDADGNGTIEINDAVLLAQYLAGWNIDFDPIGIDCDGNGVTDINDAVLLAQYLAGWNVTLGKQS